MNPESPTRTVRDRQAVATGFIANLILAGLKLSIGILGHSPALLADGINSTSDIAYYVAVAVFMRLSIKPADDEHPYGHSQLESIGALTVGAFVVTTGISIFWESLDTLYDLISGVGDFRGAAVEALWVALFTVALKISLTLYTNQVGKQTKNPSIIALAEDHRNDIFTALAAATGIYLGRAGYPWVDPFAGALVALVVLKTGINILRASTSNLMDTVPGKILNRRIRELLKDIHRIQRIDSIQAHRFGPYMVINITICVDGDISVLEGDKIATIVERMIETNIEYVRDVHVHYHPMMPDLSKQ
jgi:cation diffusion facilitator family transporter